MNPRIVEKRAVGCFFNYVRLLVRAHFAIWRPFGLEIAHDNRVMDSPYFPVLFKLACAGLLKLRYFGQSETLCGKGGMMERMDPVFRSDTEYCFVRDIDSVPLPRDRRACEEFIASERALHVIHGESKSHSGIMGGTLGMCGEPFRKRIGYDSLDALLAGGTLHEDHNWNRQGADQNFLARNVWPRFKDDTLLHELDHVTDVPCSDMRRKISGPTPSDILPIVAEHGDSFSKVIGGCSDVDRPFEFYDALPIAEMEIIRKCERDSGVKF